MAFGLCQPESGERAVAVNRLGPRSALLAEAATEPRVEDVSKRVAQEVEAKHD